MNEELQETLPEVQDTPQEAIETERKVEDSKNLPEGFRKPFEDVIANMFSNPKYIDYNFYAHVLAQCKVHFVSDMKAPAGVSFSINHYKLWVNPLEFNKFSLEEGLGVLKHEMLHILNNHCTVRAYKSDNHEAWNIAYDVAINQLINEKHLPEWVVTHKLIKAPENYSGEQYYEFMRDKSKDQEGDNQCDSCGGSGHSHDDCDECDGTGKDANGDECGHCKGSGKEPCKDCGGTGKKYRTLDDHSKWEESEGNDELRKDITKNMLDKAISKSRGNLPHNIDSMVELFSRSAQVSWKQELRRIVGNRRANKTTTIMRPNRRQPDRIELKGNKKDRTFTAVVLLDISGSMGNEDVMNGLNEIHHVAKLTNTDMKIIQVDTEIHGIENFNKKTKVFNRKGAGGTYLEPGIDYLREHKIDHDVLIIVTDSYHEDISQWKTPPKCKVMFLVSGDGKVPGIEAYPRYKQFNIKNA